jgi:hypothetical protein
VTRAELLDKVRSILKSRHFERYGIDDVDERWLNSRSDDALQKIIDADKPSAEFRLG